MPLQSDRGSVLTSQRFAHELYCLLSAPQAMDRHGLALERKPEVARAVTDGVAPSLRLLQGLLAPQMPADVLREHTNSASSSFGGVGHACCRCFR